jgi:hypothetical protein
MPRLNHRDKMVVFTYHGKTCSGHIMTSTDIEPHYYWFFFDSREFIEAIADSIAFTEDHGRLIPVHNYTRHMDLVRIVKKIIERFIGEKEL